MKIIGVIPARYASTRFPGKPLADIHGKPMIWWVYQQAMKVSEFDDIFVATDDDRISSAVMSFGGNVVMTSSNHATGTDRVAEVAEKIDADYYINIQGDEPMVEPQIIQSVINCAISHKDVHVFNLMTEITNPVDAINPTVPKVIATESGRGIYLSRSIVPFPKGSILYNLYKQVCVYAFSPTALQFFKSTQRGII